MILLCSLLRIANEKVSSEASKADTPMATWYLVALCLLVGSFGSLCPKVAAEGSTVFLSTWKDIECTQLYEPPIGAPSLWLTAGECRVVSPDILRLVRVTEYATNNTARYIYLVLLSPLSSKSPPMQNALTTLQSFFGRCTLASEC